MRLTAIGLTLAAALALCAATIVEAQQTEEKPRSNSTIADRLDQLRTNIFGTSRNRQGADQSPGQSATRQARTPRAGSKSGRGGRPQTRSRVVPSAAPDAQAADGAASDTRANDAAANDLTPEPQPEVARQPVNTSRLQRPVRSAQRPRSTRTQRTAPSASTRPPSVNVGREVNSSRARQTPSTSSRTRGSSAQTSSNSARRLVPQGEAASPFRGNAGATSTTNNRTSTAAAATPVTPAPSKSRTTVQPQPRVATSTPAPVASVRAPAQSPLRGSVTSNQVLDEDYDADSILFAQKSPLLRVEAIGPRRIVVGKEVTYRVRMQNLGDVAADGVAVQVQLPVGADVAGTDAGEGTARTIPADQSGPRRLEWQLGRLEGRSHSQLVIRLVPRDSSPFEMAVNWTSSATRGETLIEVQEPKLQLDLDGPREVVFGDSKVYRLTVANPGTGDADNVTIQLMPVDGGNQPAAQHKLGTIAAGDSKVLEVELTARQAGEVGIHAIAFDGGSLRAEVHERVLVRRADLKIQVAGPPVKYAGTLGAYTVLVSNPGNATATQVRVIASLPPGVTDVIPSDQGRLDEAGGRVEWDLGPLPAGQTRQLQVRYVMQSPGSNVLKVVAETNDDLADSGTVSTHVEATADLKLEVSDPSGPIAVGEESIYLVRVLNRGSKEARQVEVFGFFSDGVEPVVVTEGTGKLSPGQVVFTPIEVLPAGGERVFKVVAKAERGGSHVFHAEVRCKPLGTKLVAEESTLFYETEARAPIAPPSVPQAPQTGPAPQARPKAPAPQGPQAPSAPTGAIGGPAYTPPVPAAAPSRPLPPRS